MSSSTTYTVLDGEMPQDLIQMAGVPPVVKEAVLSDATGQELSNVISYFTIGQFYIDARLTEQHSSQRKPVEQHTEDLLNAFIDTGINRSQFPGVVIGVGEGWYKMKNSGPVKY
jgi:hypothetical protein